MKQPKKRVAHTIIGMSIIAVVVIGAFFLINHRSKEAGDAQKNTEIEKLLGKDLENNYPGTPREVLKLYSRMTKAIYDYKLSGQQVEDMADQMRVLFDDELLENNPRSEYIESLEAEIKEYRTLEKTIMSYVIEKSSSVEKTTVEGKEYATILATYLVKEDNDYKKSYEEFILRQNEDGRWKILGWRIVEPVEVEDDE